MNSLFALRVLSLLAILVVGLDSFMTYNFHKPINFEKFRPGNGAALSVNRRQAGNDNSLFKSSFERPSRSFRALPKLTRAQQEDVDLVNMYDTLYYPYTL